MADGDANIDDSRQDGTAGFRRLFRYTAQNDHASSQQAEEAQHNQASGHSERHAPSLQAASESATSGKSARRELCPQREADAQRHLIMGDAAVLDLAASLLDLEPAYVADR